MRLRLRLAPLALAGIAACALDPLVIPTAPTACTSNADCDDQNPCTQDLCAAGQCDNPVLAAGASCGTTDVCQGAQTCDGQGTCLTAMPIPTDDGNPCTTDACDPTSGLVTHTPVPLCWAPLPTTGAPTARKDHTAVWTGSRMIVWGGNVAGTPSVTATGASYVPAGKLWTPTSTTGAPPPRRSHVAAWTGSKMIVWGGYGTGDYETGGGLYDPVADTWSPMSTTGAPSGRTACAAVWTGSLFVVWGGMSASGPLGDGAAYDPKADTWTALPASGAPSPRYNHSAVWASDRVLVWGGYDFVNWQQDGAAYDPASGKWLGPLPLSGAPAARESHAAVWTGASMVVWGGQDPNQFIATGASLDPLAGTWLPLTGNAAPSPRASPSALWTGSAMFVWGGCGGQLCDPLADGALWQPDAGGGAWAPIDPSSAVEGRSDHTAVWTGSTALVWGGTTKDGLTATGGVFSP